MVIRKEEISAWFKELQKGICEQLAGADGKGRFVYDAWEREGGGGGLSAIMEDGKVIEKGGVNFSSVHGVAPPMMSIALKIDNAEGHDFFATGVSVVIHPFSPMVPIVHMNIRYFELGNTHWWFGGGIDLTPHYIDEDDARYFHQHLKNVCDKHHRTYYRQFKVQADDYFFIEHRKESRGIGGIFFDHLQETRDISARARFDFVKDVGLVFAPMYVHLLKKNQNLPFGEHEKMWQSIRRGRYAEFNLVYDRGTRFGLETNGRIESILMSLPPGAQWKYGHVPSPGSREEKTLSYLKKGINWTQA